MNKVVVKANGGGVSIIRKEGSYRRCRRNLRHRRYLRALIKETRNNAKFWQISKSSIHNLKTVIVRKKKTSSLNLIDCKRFVLPNCINTFAYGHYSLT